MIKCKCGREAEFDSPEDFCKYHWHEWWVEGAGHIFYGEPEKLAVEEELLEVIKRDSPEENTRMEELWCDYQDMLRELDDEPEN